MVKKSALFLTEFQRSFLCASLRKELPNQYRQRIQIMLLADEGQSQAQICSTLGCSTATVRHWMLVARIGQAHNWRTKPLGRPKRINDQFLARLKELVSQHPRDLGYPFRRWTGKWLSKHLAQEFAIELSDRHINRLLKQMGLSTRLQSSCVTAESPQENTENCHVTISDLKSKVTPGISKFH